jgi:phage terminase large subunit-like protein
MTTTLHSTDLICQPRYSTPRTSRRTYGPRVGEVAINLGYRFMPWQQYVCDVALEVDPRTGLLVYRECCLTVPRQSGKTALLLAAMVHRAHAFITERERKQRILYSAQTRIAARAKWEDEHVDILDHSRYRRDYVIRRQIGQEAIRWNNGSLHGITSNKESAGHGETLDFGVIDEAFAQEDSRLEQAFKPAMRTRDQPQIWINSTAGTRKSVFLRDKVDTGRTLTTAQVELWDEYGPSRLIEAPIFRGSCYFEWSAPEEAEPGDPETWYGCMPALGHTQRIEGIEHDFRTMDLSDFRRSSLNQWSDEFPDLWLVIKETEWKHQTDPTSKPVGRLVFAIDTTPERSFTSVSVCGRRTDGALHVETIANRPGTAWAVTAMKALNALWAGRTWHVQVVIDSASAAASMITELEDAGIEVIKTTAQQYVQACGRFYDYTVQGRVFHLGEARMTLAVSGAVKRILEASWAWARKGVELDISPLVGATLALYGFTTTDPDDDYDPLDSVR